MFLLKRRFFLERLLCLAFFLLSPKLLLMAEMDSHPKATPRKNPSTILVIPNLSSQNIDIKIIFEASNAIRTEAARQSSYVLVDHRDIFEKTKNNETKDQLIELSKQTNAEKAVIGIIKSKRQINYLQIELYNLKTNQVEKKVTTVLTSLEPMELGIICRGIIKELLESVNK